jgi:hypothetical protein
MYTWHVTFADVRVVQEHAASAQARLGGLDGIDLVPGRWLHLTTQGVGFTDEITDADLAAITRAATARLAAIEPVPVTIGPARVASEGILCWVAPDNALTPMRDAIRAAIADVWGPQRVLDGPGGPRTSASPTAVPTALPTRLRPPSTARTPSPP